MACGAARERRPSVGLAVAAALASAVALGACRGNEAAEAGGGGGEERVVPVATARAELGSIARTVGISGVVEPIRRVYVNSQLSGEIREVRVEEGDVVRAGALLARLDDRQLRAELSAAESSHEVADAAYRRGEALLESEMITQAEFDQERSRLAAAEARLAQVRTQLGFTEIRSPSAGVVTERNAEVGSVVSPQTRLFAVDDVSTLVVRVQASEMDVVHLNPGAAVEVVLDALPGRPVEGRIRRVFPSADPATRLVPVEVTLSGEAARLARPGFLARVTLALETREDVVHVPAAAVLSRGGGEAVFVVEGGRARRRPVTSGLTFRGQVEITSGLAADEEVITAGHAELRDGTAVRVTARTEPVDRLELPSEEGS